MMTWHDLIHRASPMHRATRWRQVCLSWADASTSSQVNPILWRCLFTMSLQFILGLSGLLLITDVFDKVNNDTIWLFMSLCRYIRSSVILTWRWSISRGRPILILKAQTTTSRRRWTNDAWLMMTTPTIILPISVRLILRNILSASPCPELSK